DLAFIDVEVNTFERHHATVECLDATNREEDAHSPNFLLPALERGRVGSRCARFATAGTVSVLPAELAGFPEGVIIARPPLPPPPHPCCLPPGGAPRPSECAEFLRANHRQS